MPDTSHFSKPPLPTWKWATVLGLLAAVIAGAATSTPTFPSNPPADDLTLDSTSPAAIAATVVPTPTLGVRKAGFFDASVQPQIEIANARNREAAHRCVHRINQVMQRYRNGIAPFVKDLTSLSTRLGIAKRMPAAWWYSDERVQTYVRQKFERHLFSQTSFSRDIAEVLAQFKLDVDANQNLLLSEVQASLSTSDLPGVAIDDYQPFFAAVSSDFVTFSKNQSLASVSNFATVMVASEVGSQVFVRLVGGLLARFAVSASLGAAAGGGATAGGTAIGAGAGTLAGPVGAVVGFGIGLAVGLVIDWWMTERFEDQLTKQMTAYLDQVDRALTSDHPHGLTHTLPEVCNLLQDAYRERFFSQIVTPETLSPLAVP